MSKFESLDSIIHESLIALAKWLDRNEWHGREREMVSLYAFGFLAPLRQEGSPLYHPTQIGIEVAVPQLQLPGKRRKTYVCKDLVLWEEPFGTCWAGANKEKRYPMAIMEWKMGDANDPARDKEWLKEYSAEVDNFSGYSVWIKRDGPKTTLTVSVARNGNLEELFRVPDGIVAHSTGPDPLYSKV